MGPLQGYRILEVAGLGPGPFCGMLLADMGADVIRIERPGQRSVADAVLGRGRRSICLDLKTPEGVEVVLRLCQHADALFEGFRPGVMERLGLGPDICRARNPRLVYGRVTGWGQTGPLAQAAGHDINYIALAGALHGIGAAGAKPVVPLNLIGDYCGGGMLMAFGLVCALLERRHSGVGQVVDAAMLDGASLLMSIYYPLLASGQHSDQRGTNLLDGGAHFYDTYETSDGRYISLGAIEPKFYHLLLEKLGVDPASLGPQMDHASWTVSKTRLAALFKTQPQAYWCDLLEGTDACFAPVLSPLEAPSHPHMQARGSFLDLAGLTQPAPAPRFSRTPAEVNTPAPTKGAHTEEILRLAGYSAGEVQLLQQTGIAGNEAQE